MNLLLICIVWKMTYKKNQCSKFCQKSIIYSSLLFWGNIENIPNLFARETNQTDCKAWISNKSTCHTFLSDPGFHRSDNQTIFVHISTQFGMAENMSQEMHLVFLCKDCYSNIKQCEFHVRHFYALLLNLFMVTFPGWCSLLEK